LVESFLEKIQHIVPCLKPLGREIVEIDAERGLPLANRIKCKDYKNFERLVDEELSTVGRKLNEELFTRSNFFLFRELMQERFNRTDMANWEEAYARLPVSGESSFPTGCLPSSSGGWWGNWLLIVDDDETKL